MLDEAICIDRRRVKPQCERDMKRLLNEVQLDMLRELDQFGWSLRFVRSRPDGTRSAAVYNPDRRCLAIIDPTGRLDEDPRMVFRAG